MITVLDIPERGEKMSVNRCNYKMKHLFLVVLALLFFLHPLFGYYTTQGQDIIDLRTGEAVILRGFGLGCWLLPEGYMWGIRTIDRPRQFEKAISDLIGPADAAQFWQLYHDNFVTEGDVITMAGWGVNSLRVALQADKLQPRDLQSLSPPFVYSDEGFSYLDSLVIWCERHQVGVIWDMHGAPGAQNAENIADSDGVARLWTEPDRYWPRCIDLWFQIALRYRDRDCIAGYDLLNEPLLERYKGVDPSQLRDLYIILTDTIRTVDSLGIIFIEGDDWAQDFQSLEPLDWDPHLAIAFHSYPPTSTVGGLARWDTLRQKYNIPLWHGETGEQGPPYLHNAKSTQMLAENNVGWSWWTHKKMDRQTQPWRCKRTPGFLSILDYWKGLAPKPSREVARGWLFEQAVQTHTTACEFLPDMVQSLSGLDPWGNIPPDEIIPPQILQEPEQLSIMQGMAADLVVRATGRPLFYRWFQDGQLIPGATTSQHHLNRLETIEDSTFFQVQVYNSKDSLTSSPIRVNLLPYSGPQIMHSTSELIIDGLEEDGWSPATTLIMDHVVSGRRDGNPDLSGFCKLLWDEQAVYLLISVQDDLLSDNSTEDYERDGVEIYLDCDNSKDLVYGSDDLQLRYNWHDKGIYTDIGAIEIQGECRQTDNPEGYYLECGIPWSELGIIPTHGQYIGFDIHVNDNDGRGREAKLAWWATRDNSYRSPAVFGTVQLVREDSEEKD